MAICCVDKLLCERGQSTVEYALVTAGFLSVLAALALLWSMMTDGLLLEQLLASASHHVVNVPAPNFADIFKY